MSRFGPLVALDRPAFVHDSALLYGKVAIGPDVSIWPHVVMRAEMSEIAIGEGTNIQDFVMVHVGGQTGTRIGRFCSITHHCTIHGATIGDHCLIGINATLMDGVVVGENSIVAGGAFLKEGTVIPPNSIVMGMPAKVMRTRNNGAANKLNAWMYIQNGLAYARGDHRIWQGEAFAAQAGAMLKRFQGELGE